MSENTPETTPAAEEPKGGVPQNVADDIAVLAAEVKAVEAKASRSWKISLVVWIILLGVIFCYLQFWVVDKVVKPSFEPENIVSYGKLALNGLFESMDLPAIDDGRFADSVAQKLRDAAPGLMEGTLKPRVQDLVNRAPDLRVRAVEYVRQNATPTVNNLLDRLEAQYMPQLDTYIRDFVTTTADELMDQVEEDFQDVVVELVATVQDATGEFEDQAAIELALAEAIEDGMGEHLDVMLQGLDEKVANLRVKLKSMVDRMNAGTLTERDKLELLLIQDIRMIFESREFDRQMEQSGPLEELRNMLGKLELPQITTERIIRQAAASPGEVDISMPDLEMVPEEQREAIREQIRAAQRAAAQAAAAGAEGQAQTVPLSGAVAPMEFAEPDLSHVPEEQREAIRQQIRAAQQRAAGGTATPARTAPASGAVAPVDIPEPDLSHVPEEQREAILKQIREARARAQAAAAEGGE